MAFFKRKRGGPKGVLLANVREALQEAAHTRTSIEFIPRTIAKGGSIVVATIEQVMDDGFAITQPSAGGLVRPLARYESYEMRFSTPNGCIRGDTQATARIKIPSGGNNVLYGYRMALPKQLHIVERRSEPRRYMDEEVHEAELHILNRHGPVYGVLKDISAAGARVACRNAGDSLQPGQHAYLKMELPHPVGSVNELVKVVSTDHEAERIHVRVLFEKKNTALIDAMRRAGIQLRRTRSA